MSLPTGSYSPFEIAFKDAGNEIGRFSGYGKLITAANHDAQVTAFGNLQTAAQALVLGAKTRTQYASEGIFNAPQPTNGAAREVKLLVQYEDATNHKRFTATLPTLDPTIPVYVLNVNARDVIQIDSPQAITDFIDAFEAFVVNPETGNACAVLGLKVVGRNS